jgi:catechol 2,3-dioxygenase-like lactoylglutathione lyase family enzyme
VVGNVGSVTLGAFSAVFTVNDIARSLRFFVDRLGFKEQFRMGDPLSYAIVERDAVSVQLMPAVRNPEGLGRSIIYVFADGVDRLHEELRASGCEIEIPPTDFPYGMREMSVRDPDGNRITFGQETQTAGRALS